MKICVTSQGDGLDSRVDSRLGRCEYFIFIDTESDEFEAVENPYKEAMGGAGVQAGQFISEKNVDAVITGNAGPNAFRTLKTAGINIITGGEGKVKDVVSEYKEGKLDSMDEPSVGSRFGK